jgi:Mechanosensitive ion channel, conserved TM helix
MWRDFIAELARTMDEIVQSVARFLPRFLEMLAIVAAGLAIALVLKYLLRSLLRIARFDKLSERTGATDLLRGAALPSLSELVSRFVFWVAWFGFILLGISVLGVVGIEQHVTSFFGFLPRLFVALLILFFGLLAASFLSRAALLSGVNAQLPSPRLISWAVRTMIILFVVSMAFEEIGVGSHTVIVAFTLTFGALMLGLALAFGLGGKDLARKYLEKRFGEQVPGDHRDKEREDELSPL